MRSLITIASLMLAAGFLPAQDQAVWAFLKAEAQLHGSSITLGDIAELKGTSSAAVATASALVLAPSPPAGQSKLLKASSLSTRLAGLTGIQVVLAGAPQCRANVGEVKLATANIDHMVRKWLYERLGGAASETRVTSLAASRELRARSGRESTRFEIVPEDPTAPLAGRLRLEVRALVDGRIEDRVAVVVQLERSLRHVVVKQRVRRGQPVPLSALEIVNRPVQTNPKGLIRDPSEVVGLLAGRDLVVGMPLHQHQLKRPPVLFRRDPVVVEARIGNLLVTSSGEALEEGAPGDLIRIRSGERRRVITAQVIDSRRVRLVQPGTKP